MDIPPLPPGLISPIQKELIHLWLQKNWTQPRICPVSGHSSWEVAEFLVMPPTFVRGKPALVGTGYPQVMVYCRYCGYTIYFNAVQMGVVPSNGESDG